jgi:Zn-dependent protease
MQLNLRPGRVLGTPVTIHASWHLFLGLLIWLLFSAFIPQAYPAHETATHFLFSLLLGLLAFASILFREVVRLATAARVWVQVREIVLFPFGGLPQWEHGQIPWQKEGAVALAGPLASLFLAALLFIVIPFLPDGQQSLVHWLAYFNLIVGLLGLVPGRPLDGARLLSAVGRRLDFDPKLVTTAVYLVGKLLAVSLVWSGAMMILTSYLVEGLMAVLIGCLFLGSRDSDREQQGAGKQGLPDHLSVGDFLHRQERHGEVRGHRGVGNTASETDEPIPSSPDQVIRACGGGADGASLSFKQGPRLQPWIVAADANLSEALKKMDARGLNRLLVVEEFRVIGTCSRHQLVQYVRSRSEMREG